MYQDRSAAYACYEGNPKTISEMIMVSAVKSSETEKSTFPLTVLIMMLLVLVCFIELIDWSEVSMLGS